MIMNWDKYISEQAEIHFGLSEQEQIYLDEIDALTAEIELLELQAQQGLDRGDDVDHLYAQITNLDRMLRSVHDDFMNC